VEKKSCKLQAASYKLFQIHAQALCILNIEYRISNIGYLLHFRPKKKRIMNKKMMPGEYEMEVDMSSLPPGVYFIVLKTDDAISTKKIVKL